MNNYQLYNYSPVTRCKKNQKKNCIYEKLDASFFLYKSRRAQSWCRSEEESHTLIKYVHQLLNESDGKEHLSVI